MKRIILAATATALTFGVVACTDSPDTDYLKDVTNVSDAIHAADPHSNSGTWFVPDEIQPGRYAIYPNSDPVVSLRWVQLCSDRYCEHPLSGAGEVKYAADNGPTYIVIPGDGSVQALINTGVRLERVAE